MDPHFLKHHPGEFRNLKFQSALGGEFNHLFSPDSLQCIFRFLHGLPVAHEGLTILHDAVPCDRESSAQFFLLHIPIRTDLSLSLLRIQALPIWSVPIGIEAMIAAAAESTIDPPGETAPRLTDDLADPMTLHEALSAFQLILCCFPDFRSNQCLMGVVLQGEYFAPPWSGQYLIRRPSGTPLPPKSGSAASAGGNSSGLSRRRKACPTR